MKKKNSEISSQEKNSFDPIPYPEPRWDAVLYIPEWAKPGKEQRENPGASSNRFLAGVLP